MSTKKTQKGLSLQQKVQLINDYEKSKLSVADFARKRETPLSTMKKIIITLDYTLLKTFVCLT